MACSSYGGTALTDAQLAQVVCASFGDLPLSVQVEAFAVAVAESGTYNPSAGFTTPYTGAWNNCCDIPDGHGGCITEDSRGLWQVNANAHPQFSNLFDPYQCGQAARAIYDAAGGSFTPDWATADLGSEIPYRARGQAALGAGCQAQPVPVQPSGCPTGQVQVGGQCVTPTAPCSPSYTCQNGSTVCDPSLCGEAPCVFPCPDGTFVCDDLSQCPQPPSWTCPDGSVVSDPLLCPAVPVQTPPAATCPANSSPNAAGQCECPDGTAWDFGTQFCQPIAPPYIPTPPQPMPPLICPQGYVPDPTGSYCAPILATGRGFGTTPPICPYGWGVAPSGCQPPQQQTPPPTLPTCPGGWYYDQGTERCLSLPLPSCPNGFAFDQTSGNCLALPVQQPPPATPSTNWLPYVLGGAVTYGLVYALARGRVGVQ